MGKPPQDDPDAAMVLLSLPVWILGHLVDFVATTLFPGEATEEEPADSGTFPFVEKERRFIDRHLSRHEVLIGLMVLVPGALLVGEVVWLIETGHGFLPWAPWSYGFLGIALGLGLFSLKPDLLGRAIFLWRRWLARKVGASKHPPGWAPDPAPGGEVAAGKSPPETLTPRTIVGVRSEGRSGFGSERSDEKPPAAHWVVEQVGAWVLKAIAVLAVVVLAGAVFAGHRVPPWFALDAFLGLILVALCLVGARVTVTLDPDQKTIAVNGPMGTPARTLGFDQMLAVTLAAKVSNWPIGIPLSSVTFDLFLVTRDKERILIKRGLAGQAWTGNELDRVFRLGREVAEMLGCSFLPDHPEPPQTGAGESVDPRMWRQWFAEAHGIPMAGKEQFRLDSFSDADIGILGVLTLVFLVSTLWLVYVEGPFLLAHPRAIYLMLLDAGSVGVTLFWLKRKLNDQTVSINPQKQEMAVVQETWGRRRLELLSSLADLQALDLVPEGQAQPVPGARLLLQGVFRDGSRVQLSPCAIANPSVPFLHGLFLLATLPEGQREKLNTARFWAAAAANGIRIEAFGGPPPRQVDD